jgi:thiol:disulfide interchange protein
MTHTQKMQKLIDSIWTKHRKNNSATYEEMHTRAQLGLPFWIKIDWDESRQDVVIQFVDAHSVGEDVFHFDPTKERGDE